MKILNFGWLSWKLCRILDLSFPLMFVILNIVNKSILCDFSNKDGLNYSNVRIDLKVDLHNFKIKTIKEFRQTPSFPFIKTMFCKKQMFLHLFDRQTINISFVFDKSCFAVIFIINAYLFSLQEYDGGTIKEQIESYFSR